MVALVVYLWVQLAWVTQLQLWAPPIQPPYVYSHPPEHQLTRAEVAPPNSYSHLHSALSHPLENPSTLSHDSLFALVLP